MKHNDPNNPPFYVGQKVVCVETFCWPKEYLGKIGIVTFYETLSCGCGVINVTGFDIGGKACNRHLTNYNFSALNSKMFRPIEYRHENVEIDDEIIEQAKDLIKVKETAAPVLKPIEN